MKTKEKKIEEEKIEEIKEECCCHDECECCHEDDCCHDNCACGEEEILILKNNISVLEEKVRLAQAELINYRKRKDDEVSNMLKYANQDIILEMLPVIDNLERALKALDNLDDASKKVLDGIKIIYQGLVDCLTKFGVEVINPENEEFDHNQHNALLVGEDESKPDGIILEVLMKGYKLKDRVIRPASVKVNKLS